MKQYFEKAVKIRRDLHKKPELGWCEFCTTAYIVNELEAIGWKAYLGTKQISVDAVMGRSVPLVQKSIERAKREGVSDAMLDRMQGFTGCIAEWDTGRAGPVTAFRFDIDCVGVEETKSEDHLPNKLGFQSTYEGVMHSCGHDGHAAMGMALAHWIKDNSDRLCGKFKIIFQPAEEGVRGAAAQAASGLLDDVDNLFGAHLALVCKSGEICTYPTDVLATVKLDVKFTGKPAHPTMSPELGRNALACLSTCVSELLGMSRHSKGMSCINVGHIEAGEFRNVVPVHGLLQMEVRGATDEINNYMVDQAMRIIKEGSQIFRKCRQ